MKTLKIIKIGGNIIDDESALFSFLKSFSALTGPKILVHGGGKLATQLAQKMKVKVNLLDGRRITDLPTLEIILMVYAGKINKQIIAQLQAHNCNALGLSGADCNCIVSVKRPKQHIDFGYVGDVVKVNTTILETFINQEIVPVFCAITHDQNGQLLNTNADTIAAELAIALSTSFYTELYYCFEKNGVLSDINNDASVIPSITPSNVEELIANKVIASGMLPKIKNSLHAIHHHVSKVGIGNTDMLFTPFSTYTSISK